MTVTEPDSKQFMPARPPAQSWGGLTKSNFTIGHDPSVTKDSMTTVFHRDYPSHVDVQKPKSACPPTLASVMHEDDRFINDKISETSTSFKYRYLAKPKLQYDYETLGKTNFKMNSDVSKCNVFVTTHDTYFKPLMGKNSEYKRTLPVEYPNNSCITKGDREKERLPLSDYRDHIRGHDTSVVRIYRVPPMHQGGPPTIKGDVRQGHFVTSNMDMFPGKYLSRIPTLPAPTGTNIPEGDKDKVRWPETTTTEYFPERLSKSCFKPYNLECVSASLRQTNFKEGDGQGLLDHYKSTASVSYEQKHAHVEHVKPRQPSQKSSMPEGDDDYERNLKRFSKTTSKEYFGNPPRNHRNIIVSGANLRTKSNVCFGEPPLAKQFYDTTVEKTFLPKSAPYTYTKTKYHTPSSIPLDYYNKNEITVASSRGDFKNPQQLRLIPDSQALERLSKTFILPPLADQRYFKTTHEETYVQQKLGAKALFDSQKLQQSSVPLGTLHVV